MVQTVASALFSGKSLKKAAKENLIPAAPEGMIYALVKKSVSVLADEGKEKLGQKDQTRLNKVISVAKELMKNGPEKDFEFLSQAYNKLISFKA